VLRPNYRQSFVLLHTRAVLLLFWILCLETSNETMLRNYKIYNVCVCRNDFHLRSQNCGKPLLVPSVCLLYWPTAWNKSAVTEQIILKSDFGIFFENVSTKCKFHQNRTKITGILHDDQYTFLIISRSFVVTMRNVSDRSCREKQNTLFVFNNLCSVFFPPKVVPFMR